jgi:hypothetical protein
MNREMDMAVTLALAGLLRLHAGSVHVVDRL